MNALSINFMYALKMTVALVFLFCTLQSCGDTDASSSLLGLANRRASYSVNLFPRETVVDDARSLAKPEAMKLSNTVLLASHIEKIDGSNIRGAKEFYIYKITHAKLVKADRKHSNVLPLYFFSKRDLFKGSIYTETAYIFLVPLSQYNILQNNLEIRYKWLDRAPLLKE